jgi:long-chain-fatty-acid--CoA ligase ACSBG
MGYLYMPEQTKAVIGDDGFMSTGDVAIIDHNDDPRVGNNSGKKISISRISCYNWSINNVTGFIKITGRTKEIIITAGAENIAPLAIEGEMKNEMPALANCLVIGDKRKYLTMLISLKCEVDVETNIPTDILAPMSLHVGKEIGSNATTMSEAARDPKWIEYIDSGMARANERAGMHTI